ncbi:MAG: alpha/beta fold hydrolase [Chloroflexi bacterium]|nr:alpha/beta fold hydrolase [Chloroflexota bacterium]
MATLTRMYSTRQHSRLALVFGLLILAALVFTACSGSDEPEDQVIEPTATTAISTASVEPTATASAPSATQSAPTTQEASPTATAVPPSQTATPPAQPASTPEPEIDRSVVTYIDVPDPVDHLLAAAGELFVGSTSSGFLSRRSIPSGESIGSIRGGREGVRDIAFDGENLWTADLSASQVRKTSPDGTDLGRFDVKSPEGIVFDGASIWVTNKVSGTVTNLALDGSEIGVYEAGPFPEKIAFDGTDIWVTNATEDSVSRISQSGELLETIYLGVGRSTAGIVADEKYVWVANGFYFLTRIPLDDAPIREFVVGRISGGGPLALDDDSVYMGHRQGEDFGSVTRLSHDGDWLSTVIIGGDDPTSIEVIDGVVYVGLDVGAQVAVVHPEAMASGAPTVPDGVVEIEVTIEGREATVTGILTKPAGPGPHPAVLFVNGAGSDNRDGIFTWRQVREADHHHAQQGIATLRLDDRGIGMSTGKVLDTTIASRIVDSIDAFEFLKAQDGIDPAKVGLLGHSEGGAVVAAVAAQIEVAFVVSIAGPVAPIKDVLRLQTQRLLEADGSPESYVNSVLEDTAFAHNAILTGENLEELEQLIELGSVIIIAPDYIMADEKELVTIWFQDFLKYDPGPSWAAVEEPILAIFGEKDWIVPTEQNEPLLREILTNSGHTNHHIQILPGANHFFQPAETGSIGEIGTNPREFIPGFLDLISSWINDQVGGG